MKHWDTVTIVGVGLIGGSIGLALRQRRLARRVVGVGRRASSLRKARRRSALTSATTSLTRGVADADLVVVCTPVERIVEDVRRAAEHCGPGARITDVGSAKAEIVEALGRDRGGRLGKDVAFVGSHPLAGSDKKGPQFARGDLFQDRVAIVTPTRRTRPDDAAAIDQFWTALGSRVVRMTPRAHDEAIAATSHAPHLVASALAAATPEGLLPLAAGGWLDTTRVAAADAELWRQIVGANRAHVLKSLDRFVRVLSSLRRALARGDQERILRILEAGKRNRDAVGG
jgi:prephenate dehydrogenase